MEYLEKEYKTILNSHKFINPWLWDRYSLSAYQGCEFQCIYCYAREGKYSKYFGEKDRIFIKKNAARMLDSRISHSRTLLPDVVGISGMCDPYQWGEAEFLETRNCLEVLAKHRWPVHILTKSPLVTRDLDLLAQIARDSWAAVSFTITTTNTAVAKFLEPNAIAPEERFKALSAIKQSHPEILAGITAIPIVPGLEDREADLNQLITLAAEAGADYFLFSPGLTLEGEQALLFLRKLAAFQPEHLPRLEELYKFAYSEKEYTGTYGPKKSYIARLSKYLWERLEQAKLPWRIPRFIPADYRQLNYLIAEKLLNEAHQLKTLGKPWTSLFWAGQNIQNLKESIADLAQSGRLGTVRNVTPEIETMIRAKLLTGN